MATVRLRPASPDAVPACHRPPRRSMPHPRQVAPTNEGERVGYGLVSARPELSLLEPRGGKKRVAAGSGHSGQYLGGLGTQSSPGDQCPSHPPFGLALLGPHVARELRCSQLGVRRLGQAKARPSQIHTSSPERGCRTRVSTPERLHCVDHPRLVGDPVGLRSAGTWREDPRSFPGTWLVVDEVLKSGVTTYTVFGSTAPEGLVDQARGGKRRGRTRAGVVLTDVYAILARPTRTGAPPPGSGARRDGAHTSAQPQRRRP